MGREERRTVAFQVEARHRPSKLVADGELELLGRGWTELRNRHVDRPSRRFALLFLRVVVREDAYERRSTGVRGRRREGADVPFSSTNHRDL